MNTQAVAEARRWIGTPYRHQASALGNGCDCLGLLRGVWRALYGEEPETIPAYPADPRRDRAPDRLWQAAETYLTPRVGPPDLGDVLLFRLSQRLPPRHCGIVSDNGRFIHAQERIGVVEGALSASWTRRVAGVFSFSNFKA